MSEELRDLREDLVGELNAINLYEKYIETIKNNKGSKTCHS